MSIYKKVLGEQFHKLHPKLQERFLFQNAKPFQAKGVMKKIQGGPKLIYPLLWFGTKWKLIFPEHGENIPFTIVNTPFISEQGEEQIHWERIFYFGEKKRYFNALMSYDAERNLIKDYFGEPSVFYSDLAFQVTNEGFLQIESRNQRLVIGKIEIPLPKLFQAIATVTEKYIEEKGVYEISVLVKNPLVGVIFSYEGEFKPNVLE